MKSINAALTVLALFTTVALAACGNNSNSIQTNSDAPGAGALGANVDINQCQVNQAYSTQYGCLNRGTCQLGQGYSAQANACVTGQLVTEQSKFGTSSNTRHYAAITITNSQQMELLLQQAGLCNSTVGYTSNYSYGNSSSTRCAQWITRGTFAVVKSFSGSADGVNLTIGAGTQFPTDLVTVVPGLYGSQLGYSGSMYASSNYLSFNQQSRMVSYNNSNGVELVGVSQGHAISLMVLINNGNLGQDSVDAQLIYQNVQIGTMTLQRF